MKLRIDALDTTSGWTINAPSVLALNEFRQYIAGVGINASLIAQFKTGDTTKTLTKTLAEPVNISDYEFLVFSMWSLNKGKQIYGRNIASEFSYKIKINATDEFYIPVKDSFTDININIEDIDSMDRIEITALFTDEDTIILSEMLVEYEQMPIDLLEEAKSGLEGYLTQMLGRGLLLGTVSASSGDRTLDVGDFDYIDRYSVIMINDEVNSEIHQIEKYNDDSGRVRLSDTYDGNTIQNNYTDANIYLTFPVVINPDERYVRLPGICIWGFAPELLLRTGKTDTFIESYKTDGTVVERIEGQVCVYTVTFDCESRSSELLAIMSKAVRDFLGNELIWVNGRRHEIDFPSPATETKPAQGVDIIPKIQYQMNVEVIEIIAPAERLVNTTTINTNVGVR